MKMKKLTALILALMLLLQPLSGVVRAVDDDGLISTVLDPQQIEASSADLDIQTNTPAQEQLDAAAAMADEDGMVDVFIVMEGDSILEDDAFAEITDAETQLAIQELEANQSQVISRIEETVLEGELLDVSYSYTWLVNAIAASVPVSAMTQIAKVAGVSQIIVQPVYELYESTVTTGTDASLYTISDGVMIDRESAWAQGYTGQGMKIAVIDTGLDTDHPNFQPLPGDKLTGDSATVDSISQVLSSLNASSRYNGLTAEALYLNTKVAYAFNYADNWLDVTHANDGQGDHGTHVAGIAAANKIDASQVVGVAPDAQLFILKVFGLQRAGASADIIAALEDALILGSDVINMSLGSDAGFTSSADAFISAIYDRVAETGTILCVSAGNNYTAGLMNHWGTDANLTSNPDNGVLGEPGAYQNVLSVASVENWKIQRMYIDAGGYYMGYTETSASYGLPAVTTLTEEYPLAYVPGYGEEADYGDLDVTGKVVLVQRGVISFAEKCQNAQAAGAVACLVYNNTSGEFGMDLTDCTATIPIAAITLADGEYLITALAADPALTVRFPLEPTAIASDTAYQMSDFSAWGAAPDLSLEPDITAPGGNIYSTLDDGTYGLLSGTSMASPNMAGISALVMQYVKQTIGEENARVLVQNLLVSTAVPLVYQDQDGLYYSPRSQGSGLANALAAMMTQTYLTVDGMEVPKAELYDDPDKTGSYSYQFHVHNFGDTAAYYLLNTVVQSEGVTEFEEYPGQYFMSSTPVALDASGSESSENLVLIHDVDDDGTAGSHDAYHIYLAAIGAAESHSWADEAFRYDTTADDAVDTEDVQAYLDALVGNDSPADLTSQVLKVDAGGDVLVSVAIALNPDARTYLDTYYPNGGYVEGFTFLSGCNAAATDLSLPYLAFYGAWDAAPVIDSGNYWDLINSDDENAIIGNQYYNVLWTNFAGTTGGSYPGYNVYVEEDIQLSHIAVSPNEDGYYDTIEDIYTSLLRNAAGLTYRYTDSVTGQVYYEQTAQKVRKSVYSSGNGTMLPSIYSWYAGEIEMFDWTDGNGNYLPNDTQLLLEVEASIDYQGSRTDSWSVPIYVDLEAPAITSAVRIEDPETGEVSLEVSFKDNHAVAYIILASRDGKTAYYIQGVEDVEDDPQGYQNHTVTFDITDLDGKLMVLIGDYALNESAYGLNAGGEGASYGSLVGFRYSVEGGSDGWVSFDPGVACDETYLFDSSIPMVCAEYIGGYVFAQDESGKLYGFRYQDMLKDTFELETSYVAQLENVYQDLAYDYATGTLYGLYTYDDNGYPYTEVFTISLNSYEETWYSSRGGLYGLAMAVNDAGLIYVLGPNYLRETETLTESAYLWKVEKVTASWYETLRFVEIGSVGISMDYLQSMTYDHNTETLYWARFDATATSTVCELYTIEPDTMVSLTDEETGQELGSVVKTTRVGEMNGEICALFAPLGEEAAAQEAHQNLPVMDSSVMATPILRETILTMNVGGSHQLVYDLNPWYSDHKEMVWSSTDTSVVTVSDSGMVTAVGPGSAQIIVFNRENKRLRSACSVQVTALDLVFEGIVSGQAAGIGHTTGVNTYRFEMVDGLAEFGTIAPITAPEDLDFGLSLATSELGRGSLWACEYGNTGMIYEIDPETGVVKDVLQPMNGDMVFGLSYSEKLDTFSAIMNMYLYVDLELTHEEQQIMINSYDPETAEFTYHSINLLSYLIASNDNFVTGEDGNGASSEIVLCGITGIDNTDGTAITATINASEVTYTPAQTLVLLDNVGRLWYMDELQGLSREEAAGSFSYYNADGSVYISGGDSEGVYSIAAGTDDSGNTLYNVFVIRQIHETPLTDMFRAGTMPRITYHFSDIEYAGKTASGAELFALSLYDYWNNGTTNELYLLATGGSSADQLYNLGNTGNHNIIATIHRAEVTGGIDLAAQTGTETNSLACSRYPR